MKSWLIFLCVSLLTTFTLTGCQTMEGFGRDVEKVGGEIEEAADR